MTQRDWKVKDCFGLVRSVISAQAQSLLLCTALSYSALSCHGGTTKKLGGGHSKKKFPAEFVPPPHFQNASGAFGGRGHFRSCDKDGGHTIRLAVSENPMLYANFTTLSMSARLCRNVVRATSLVNGKPRFLDPRGSKTPEPIDIKFDRGD